MAFCLCLAVASLLLPAAFSGYFSHAYGADPTGPPPVNPPATPPATIMPDLRGIWIGTGKLARADGYRDVSITLKVTERGPLNLYRGWLTAAFPGQAASTTIFTAKLDADNRLYVTQPVHTRTFRLEWQQTTNLTVFPTGWQPVLLGVGQRLDDKTDPDDSCSTFLILKKTKP